MNENFKFKCMRRSGNPRIDIEDSTCLGAGSGGDPEDGGTTRYIDGTYTINAGRIALETLSPYTAHEAAPLPGAHTIDLIADDGTGNDGHVAVKGTKGVRITAGPPKLPPMSAENTNGVEIAVGDEQVIHLMRGLLPGVVDQSILMEPGSIEIDAGTGDVTIESTTSIQLSVMDGLSSITLTPSGIVIKGLVVQIN